MDADIIMNPNKSKSLITSLMEAVGKIQFKFLILLFVMFVFISSDVFIDRILVSFDGATELHSTTNYGVVLQGLFLVLGYVMLEILVDQNII
jgi:hypothetical protein